MNPHRRHGRRRGHTNLLLVAPRPAPPTPSVLAEGGRNRSEQPLTRLRKYELCRLPLSLWFRIRPILFEEKRSTRGWNPRSEALP